MRLVLVIEVESHIEIDEAKLTDYYGEVSTRKLQGLIERAIEGREGALTRDALASVIGASYERNAHIQATALIDERCEAHGVWFPADPMRLRWCPTCKEEKHAHKT